MYGYAEIVDEVRIRKDGVSRIDDGVDASTQRIHLHTDHTNDRSAPEPDTGRVDPRVGLGRVGLGHKK